MTWIDNNGEVRPQSWEEYLRMKQTVTIDVDMLDRIIAEDEVRFAESRVRRSLKPIPRMRPRLYLADPHCFWCGIRVYLNVSSSQPDFATVDHLYSRFHPEREGRHKQGGTLHVLACRTCNQERATAETRQQIFIPKLKEREEFARRADATMARKLHAERVEVSAEKPKLRIIQTIQEAINYAREHPGR